jgi:hypothetical protein
MRRIVDTRLNPAGIRPGVPAMGEEVDFVVEVGRQLIPIVVKATARPRLRDAGPLRAFRAESPQPRERRAGRLRHAEARRFADDARRGDFAAALPPPL